MANQVVKVKREELVACMTCPLCNKLFKDATTISECLHTFCRKCIYEKITEEDTEHCPICNTDLGSVPLEKLRPDHSWQDVRAKLFPLKKIKVNEPESTPSALLPARRKERSLSSLVVSTPRVSSTQGTMTGKRTKAVARKASTLQGSSLLAERSANNEDESAEDNADSQSSVEASNKSGEKTRLSSVSADPNELLSNKESESGAESWDGKDLWKPLNCLVEVANRTKSLKPNSQGSERVEQAICPSETQVRKFKSKENKQKSKVDDEKNNTHPPSPETNKPKKLRKACQKREASGERSVTPQAVLDAAGGKPERRIGPIRFSPVASEEQEGEGCLPQIPTNYLRIKDGSVPVSFIQKYLTRKLDLTSETEVEINCMGQPVSLNEYGCADEKFVRAMVQDLVGIEIDRLKYKHNTPQQNRQAAREKMMQALFAVYSIDANEDTAVLQEEVAKLKSHISFLEAEKKKLQKDKTALAEKLSKLQLHSAELEAKAARVPELEADVDSLKRQLEKLRAVEQKTLEQEKQIEVLQGEVPEHCSRAVAQFKESEEFKALLKAAREGVITDLFHEWSKHGYLDRKKMLADLIAAREAKAKALQVAS